MGLHDSYEDEVSHSLLAPKKILDVRKLFDDPTYISNKVRCDLCSSVGDTLTLRIVFACTSRVGIIYAHTCTCPVVPWTIPGSTYTVLP